MNAEGVWEPTLQKTAHGETAHLGERLFSLIRAGSGYEYSEATGYTQIRP